MNSSEHSQVYQAGYKAGSRAGYENGRKTMAGELALLLGEIKRLESHLLAAWQAYIKSTRKVDTLHKIVFPCKTCHGIGTLDDAGFGDISYSTWDCEVCGGFNVLAEKAKLKEDR